MNENLDLLLKFLEENGIEVEDAYDSNGNIRLELGFENVKNKIGARELLYTLIKKFNRKNYKTPVFLISNVDFDSDKFGGVGTANLRFADSNFEKNTFQNYEVALIKESTGGRKYAIIKRKRDYVIGAGYDVNTGTWDHGYYDYSTFEEAKNDLARVAAISGNEFKDAVKDALVEPTDEIEYVKYKLNQHGFKILREGKTTFGRQHIEFEVTPETYDKAVELIQMFDDILDERKVPITFNITEKLGVIDINKKYVEDSVKDTVGVYKVRYGGKDDEIQYTSVVAVLANSIEEAEKKFKEYKNGRLANKEIFNIYNTDESLETLKEKGMTVIDSVKAEDRVVPEFKNTTLKELGFKPFGKFKFGATAINKITGEAIATYDDDLSIAVKNLLNNIKYHEDQEGWEFYKFKNEVED